MRFRLTLILCFFFTKIVFSQQFDRQPRVSIPSPNVMSFAVFDGFPAVPNTGIPDINVPVYDFKYREINIPISLRYNTNLVKPDIQPSWVGLGWNLDVGGQITRVVNDKPDDLEYIDEYVYGITHENKVGYWYNHEFFKNNGWDNEVKVKAAADDWRNYPSYIALLGYPASVKDYEADDFVFSFLGINGKFYLDADRKWRVRCDQKIKVEINESDISTKGFLKITLTDTKGTKYIFGGNENATEYANSLFFTYKQRLQAKSWQLSKIILNNNEEINFSYKKVHPSVTATPNFFSNSGVTGFPKGGMLHAGSITVPSYLEKIEAPNGEVLFNSSNSIQLAFDRKKFAYMQQRISENYIKAVNAPALIFNWNFERNIFPIPNLVNTEANVPTSSLIGLKLDEISIKNKLDEEVKSFKFDYTNNANERLKLLKFETQDKVSAQKINTYQFSYNTLRLPEYLSSKTDHWGFYNGKLLDFSNTNAFYNSKRPDPEYAKAEVLNKIEYPTGGYSTYEFEGHSYSKELDTIRSNPLLNYNLDKITGGLRIKKIINFSTLGQIETSKEFKYVRGYSIGGGTNQLSSGVLGGKSLYDLYALSDGSISAGDIQAAYPLANNANGSHIVYSEVVEKYGEGYQINYYSNFDTGINGEYMDGPPEFSIGISNQKYNERDFERGVLLKRETFTNTGILVSKSQIKYDRIIGDNEFVKNIKAGVIGTAVPGNPSASTFTGYRGSYYKKFTHAYLPIEEINTSYDFLGSNPVSTVKKYEYDLNTKNLKSESLLNSKNNLVKKTSLFPYDMVALNRDPQNIYEAMVAKNMISPVIEQVEVNNNNQTFLQRTNFGKFTSSDLLLPKSTEEQVGLNPIETKSIFNSYDILGNLLTSSYKGSAKDGRLWGYNGHYPIAESINAAGEEIYYESFEESAASAVVKGIAHTGDRFYEGTTYALNWTKPNQRNYIYTYWYRLNGVWKWSSPQAYNGNTNLTLGDAYDDILIYPEEAQVATYTYRPLIGMSSKIDNKGLTTYYKYDSFGQLKYIKDSEKNILKQYSYNQANEVNDGLQINSQSFCKYREQTIAIIAPPTDANIEWEISGGEIISGQGTPEIKILPQISGKITLKAVMSIGNSVSDTYSWVLNDATIYSTEDLIDGPNNVCGEAGFSFRYPELYNEVIWKTSDNIVMVPYDENLQYALPNFLRYSDQAGIGPYGWVEALLGCTLYRKEVGMFPNPNDLFYTVMNQGLDYGGYACNNNGTELKLSWQQNLGDYSFYWSLPNGWTYNDISSSSNGEHVFVYPPQNEQPTGSTTFYVEASSPSCGPIFVVAYGFNLVNCGGAAFSSTAKSTRNQMNTVNLKPSVQSDDLNKARINVAQVKLYNSEGLLVREAKGNFLNVSGLSEGKYELHIVEGDKIAKKEYAVKAKTNSINKSK